LKRLFITPLLWGFFLSAPAWSANLAPHLNSTVADRLKERMVSTPVSQIGARILAIRVEFQPDTLSTTTGNGTFGSGIPSDFQVDPLPHNRSYFEDHLQFLGNYFSEISDSSVRVDTFAVFPQALNDAYLLDHQMWHYNYNTTPEDLDVRLGWLFRDAWEAAGQDMAIHPADYNTFIIFHAGVGKDFALGFDETPHDIPSAYFTLQDLCDALGYPEYPGVVVNGDTVAGGLLLPECEYQPEVDAEIAMNGTEALLFATSLGLPALYDTDNGNTGVGRFDLMDQGSGNFAGLVPSRPCAWSRTFMGWADPVLLAPSAEADTFWVNIHGRGDAGDSTQHEIYRINLNASEYYLMENRSWDPDSLTYTIAYDGDGNRLQINEDYTVEKLDGEFGVIVRVENYDFGIPGEGILIWHVDDSVIEANYAANRVNADLSHRGVELVEADGAQDIGQSYGFFDVGYGTELGWAGDFFFGGNSQFLAANPQISTVVFYDDSHPGTRTHDGSPTGLRIGGFSEAGDVMRFWIDNNWTQAGFPVQLTDAAGILSPSALDFDADGKTDWILTVTSNGYVQAFDSLGRAQGNYYRTRWDANLLGDSTIVTDTLLALLPGVRGTPAFATDYGNFPAVIPSLAGRIYLFDYPMPAGPPSLSYVQLDTLAQASPLVRDNMAGLTWYIGDMLGNLYAFRDSTLLWRIAPFENESIAGLCLSDSGEAASIFMVTNYGGVALVDQLGDSIWTKRLNLRSVGAPIAINHQKYSRWDLVVLGFDGEVALLNPENGEYRSGFPLTTEMTVWASPTAGDFDRDGRMEVVVAGQNRIQAVAENGVLEANWPLILDARQPNNSNISPFRSPPTISELGFEGELYVLFGWPYKSVDARNRWGGQAPGFMRSTGFGVSSAPLIVQLDDDAEMELVALDAFGHLYCWHLDQLGDFDAQRRPWNGYQNGNRRQGWAIDNVDVINPPTETLVETKVYPWPNPANEVSHIRYLMGQSGRITVRIFDGAGDLVKEITGSAEAGIEGDLAWDLADVSSGVYIGRVEAEAEGKTERTFIKIAVVK